MDDSVSSTTGHYNKPASSLKMTLIKNGPQYSISAGQQQQNHQAIVRRQSPQVTYSQPNSDLTSPQPSRPSPCSSVSSAITHCPVLATSTGQQFVKQTALYGNPPVTAVCSNGHILTTGSVCSYPGQSPGSYIIKPMATLQMPYPPAITPLRSPLKTAKHQLPSLTPIHPNTASGQSNYLVETNMVVPALFKQSYQAHSYNYSAYSSALLADNPTLQQQMMKSVAAQYSQLPTGHYPLVRRLLSQSAGHSALPSVERVSTGTNTEWVGDSAGADRPVLSTATQTEPNLAFGCQSWREQMSSWKTHRAVMAYLSFCSEMKPKLCKGRLAAITPAEEQGIDKKLRNLWNQMSLEKRKSYFEKSISKRKNDQADAKNNQAQDQVMAKIIDDKLEETGLQVKKVKLVTQCDKVIDDCPANKKPADQDIVVLYQDTEQGAKTRKTLFSSIEELARPHRPATN